MELFGCFFMSRYRRLQETVKAEGLSDQEVNCQNLISNQFMVSVFTRNWRNAIYMWRKRPNIYV
jgi:hypothetical protein